MLLLNCLLNFYEILHSCSTQPADVHEGIPLLSKIPKFEYHSIASGGYHSVGSLTVLVKYEIFAFLKRNKYLTWRLVGGAHVCIDLVNYLQDTLLFTRAISPKFLLLLLFS
jgi:hypothetical protein